MGLLGQKINKILYKKAKPAHNKRLTLRRLTAARGSVRLGHGFTIPTPHSTHSLQALVFASQSPYTGLQTVVNLERYVKYHPKIVCNIFQKDF
jgi:hypothetical protein